MTQLLNTQRFSRFKVGAASQDSVAQKFSVEAGSINAAMEAVPRQRGLIPQYKIAEQKGEGHFIVEVESRLCQHDGQKADAIFCGDCGLRIKPSPLIRSMLNDAPVLMPPYITVDACSGTNPASVALHPEGNFKV